MTRLAPRRGALLPMVLVVMVIIALAACAALFTARQERRATWQTRLRTSAQATADRTEADLSSELATVAHTLPIGSSITRSPAGSEGIAWSATFSRLAPALFLLITDATAASPQGLSAYRRTSLLLRLDAPAAGFPAALSVVGPAPPAPSIADGSDRPPDGWACDTVRSDTAAVRHPSPAPDSALLAALRTRASIRLPPGAVLRAVQPVVSGGACATNRADNWGDPARAGPCGSWLPVIHAAGDLVVGGGAGQGTLLVDGNLTVGGSFRFTGAVIVRGTINVDTGGASFTGGVIANAVMQPDGRESGAPIVARSTCAVGAALLAAGALVPVADRAWASMR